MSILLQQLYQLKSQPVAEVFGSDEDYLNHQMKCLCQSMSTRTCAQSVQLLIQLLQLSPKQKLQIVDQFAKNCCQEKFNVL